MVEKKTRDSETGRFVSAPIKPKEAIPDLGKCSACNSNLVKLLVDSRAAIPQYVVVCNNQDCPQYRFIVSRE